MRAPNLMQKFLTRAVWNNKLVDSIDSLRLIREAVPFHFPLSTRTLLAKMPDDR
jgi:hypothetical protein